MQSSHYSDQNQDKVANVGTTHFVTTFLLIT